MQVEVYKSLKKDLMYLYVTVDDGLSKVPDALLAQFGQTELALTFELTSDRSLAKEDPAQVLANLEAQGYHLQMPPVDEPRRT